MKSALSNLDSAGITGRRIIVNETNAMLDFIYNLRERYDDNFEVILDESYKCEELENLAEAFRNYFIQASMKSEDLSRIMEYYRTSNHSSLINQNLIF